MESTSQFTTRPASSPLCLTTWSPLVSAIQSATRLPALTARAQRTPHPGLPFDWPLSWSPVFQHDHNSLQSSGACCRSSLWQSSRVEAPRHPRAAAVRGPCSAVLDSILFYSIRYEASPLPRMLPPVSIPLESNRSLSTCRAVTTRANTAQKSWTLPSRSNPSHHHAHTDTRTHTRQHTRTRPRRASWHVDGWMERSRV